MKLLSIGLLVIFGLAGCATTLPMEKVIDVCNSQDAPFPQVSQCIKDMYAQKGNTPNANSVKAVYAELAVISEDYQTRKITNTQARANLYRAYSDTVGADNRSNKGRVCMPINGMIFCQ